MAFRRGSYLVGKMGGLDKKGLKAGSWEETGSIQEGGAVLGEVVTVGAGEQ